MGQLQQLLSGEGRRSLRSLINLISNLFSLNGLNFPFDGRILDGTDQAILEIFFIKNAREFQISLKFERWEYNAFVKKSFLSKLTVLHIPFMS